MSKLTPLQATAPRKIFLQIDDHEGGHDELFPDDTEGVTWCAEPAQACEVAYVREDIAAAAPSPAPAGADPEREYAIWIKDQWVPCAMPAGGAEPLGSGYRDLQWKYWRDALVAGELTGFEIAEAWAASVRAGVNREDWLACLTTQVVGTRSTYTRSPIPGDAPTLLNGLTEQETAASASVAGLSVAQPEAPAEPSASDKLHEAICHAVAIMNNSFDVARSEECRKAKDILRQALMDYVEPPAPAAQQAELTDAARDVLAERARQITAEGWTPEHDDEHDDGAMAVAAACYSIADKGKALAVQTVRVEKLWEWSGWSLVWFKPSDRRSNLIKAGALILAEIERLDRAAIKAQGGSNV